MRKLFVFVLIAALSLVAASVFAQPGWQTSPGAGDIMGNGRGQMSDPHKTFRLVRYMPVLGGSALVKGNMVVWDDSASGDDGVTITTTTNSDDSKVAGVMATAAPLCASGHVYQDGSTPDSASDDLNDNNWGWLQTYGYATVRIGSGDNVSVSGAAMGTSETAGCAGGYLPSTTMNSRQGYAGFFYDIPAASDTAAKCFIKCE